MTHIDDLVAASTAFLGEPVEAAAVFGLDDDGLVTAGGLAASVSADTFLPQNPLVDGAAAAAGIHAAREVHAREVGLDVRMVLAVTAESYHLLDWHEGRCTRELVRFPRPTTHVQITTFGLSRRVRLTDPASGADVTLTGSTSFLSSESAADKKVLAVLAGDAA